MNPDKAPLASWTQAQRRQLVQRVRQVSGDRPIAPVDPFRALRVLAPGDVRVVVIGQDPYPTPGQADGLAFSAERSSRPSLRRVFDVLEADRPGWQRPASGRLDAWARQGVLLLNTVLTVELGRPASHLDVGWQVLTSLIVRVLWSRDDPPVFMLWGRHARAFHDAARPAGAAGRVLITRRPSNDTRREFMADGSHFTATADRVEWRRSAPSARRSFPRCCPTTSSTWAWSAACISWWATRSGSDATIEDARETSDVSHP